MKVTLDLEQLLRTGQITQTEYEKLKNLATQSTGFLAFNIMIGFGVLAVSGAALALAPNPTGATLIGLLVFALGFILMRRYGRQWQILANICILLGALMTGGAILAQFQGSLISILGVTVIFALGSVLAQSALLAVLATLMLAASLGARTGYFQASYLIVIKEPTATIILFTALALALYHLSKKLAPEYARLAIASARTGVFLVNFGFWIGSLWGEYSESRGFIIADTFFALLWALALTATAIWAWQVNSRWVLNTVAVFGGIHFYTQWFERLGASPITVLIAGLLALGLAVGLGRINAAMIQVPQPGLSASASGSSSDQDREPPV